MILTITSSLTWTTCSGISTWRSASSETCTRPSMPSSTRTNAPNGTSLVTLPGTICPIWWVRAKACHGSSCVALSDSETRSRSSSTLEHLDGDLLADLDHLGGVIDVLPGQLGDVHQAVHATQIDEGAEVDDRGDDTLADLARLQLGEEALPHLGLGLLEPGPAGQHDVVAVLVQLDDLGLELHADVRLKVANAAHLDQRCGQEAAQADVDDQAALDDLDHAAGDDAVLFLDLLDRAPGALVLSPLLGQDQSTLLVLFLLDQGLDLVADADHIEGVDVVLDGEFFGGDDPFGLVTDVEEDLVPVDLDDGAGDDVAVVEILDRCVDGREKGFGRAEVVDCDLRWCLERGRHVVGLRDG